MFSYRKHNMCILKVRELKWNSCVSKMKSQHKIYSIMLLSIRQYIVCRKVLPLTEKQLACNLEMIRDLEIIFTARIVAFENEKRESELQNLQLHCSREENSSLRNESQLCKWDRKKFLCGFVTKSVEYSNAHLSFRSSNLTILLL